MKSEKNIPIMAISALIAGYGVIKLMKLKSSEADKISENETLKAAGALLVGLFGLGIGYIGFNKA